MKSKVTVPNSNILLGFGFWTWELDAEGRIGQKRKPAKVTAGARKTLIPILYYSIFRLVCTETATLPTGPSGLGKSHTNKKLPYTQ